jgi:hypothetical protein
VIRLVAALILIYLGAIAAASSHLSAHNAGKVKSTRIAARQP